MCDTVELTIIEDIEEAIGRLRILKWTVDGMFRKEVPSLRHVVQYKQTDIDTLINIIQDIEAQLREAMQVYKEYFHFPGHTD